jgi:hypothetical protein
LIGQSSKLTYLKQILDQVQGTGEKALIFTVYKNMQKILIKAMRYWYGLQVHVLNGEIDQDKRKHVLQQFRQSPGFNVLILSPEVGGVGINLVEANHVIHYTRLWNPAKEDQATDRAYRIGQKKEVHVYYPILNFGQQAQYTFHSLQEYVERYEKGDVQGKSPEEKLNRLLIQKKNLLLHFFFAAGNTDIDWGLLSDDHTGVASEYSPMEILSKIEPHEFEILVGQLYKKMGYLSYATKQSGDQGVDVVAYRDEQLTLIQCKLFRSELLPKSAIAEVVGARNVYSQELGKPVEKLVVVTTAERMTNDVQLVAQSNGVTVILQDELYQLLRKHPIFYSEVSTNNAERYSLQKLKSVLN